MGHKNYGKYYIGPGGINCNCCTKFPPEKLKVKVRRLERHKANIIEIEE
jgi:hypothetical protein